jgi:hypothetical protein
MANEAFHDFVGFIPNGRRGTASTY